MHIGDYHGGQLRFVFVIIVVVNYVTIQSG